VSIGFRTLDKEIASKEFFFKLQKVGKAKQEYKFPFRFLLYWFNCNKFKIKSAVLIVNKENQEPFHIDAFLLFPWNCEWEIFSRNREIMRIVLDEFSDSIIPKVCEHLKLLRKYIMSKNRISKVV